MQKVYFCALAFCCFAACSRSQGPTKNDVHQTEDGVRTYNATASVGDFMVIHVHPDTSTIDYENRTTGEAGTVEYSVNGDGRYDIADPDGRLVAAYEIPGRTLVMQAAMMGPSRTEPALIVGAVETWLSFDDLEGKSFNTVQFRTTEGGIEVGQLEVLSSGDVNINTYYPAGEFLGTAAYNTMTIAAANFADDPAAGTIVGGPTGEEPATLFGIPGSYLMIDTRNGSIVGFPSAARGSFDTAAVGTYRAIIYSNEEREARRPVRTGERRS